MPSRLLKGIEQTSKLNTAHDVGSFPSSYDSHNLFVDGKRKDSLSAMFQDVSIWGGWQSLCSFPCLSLLEMWGVWPWFEQPPSFPLPKKTGPLKGSQNSLQGLLCAEIKRSCVTHSTARVLGWTDQQYSSKMEDPWISMTYPKAIWNLKPHFWLNIWQHNQLVNQGQNEIIFSSLLWRIPEWNGLSNKNI